MSFIIRESAPARSSSNPKPLFAEEAVAGNITDALSEDKLRRITGGKDLSSVLSVELKVDTSQYSLALLGERLPALNQLRLRNSLLTRVRDLGTKLKCLRVLWVSQCGVADLDGITALPNLEELYAAFNSVEDVTPLGMMDKLIVVDLEGNAVSEVESVEYLALCGNLGSLTLDGCPISQAVGYRGDVLAALPLLETLDGLPRDYIGDAGEGMDMDESMEALAAELGVTGGSQGVDNNTNHNHYFTHGGSSGSRPPPPASTGSRASLNKYIRQMTEDQRADACLSPRGGDLSGSASDLMLTGSGGSGRDSHRSNGGGSTGRDSHRSTGSTGSTVREEMLIVEASLRRGGGSAFANDLEAATIAIEEEDLDAALNALTGGGEEEGSPFPPPPLIIGGGPSPPPGGPPGGPPPGSSRPTTGRAPRGRRRMVVAASNTAVSDLITPRVGSEAVRPVTALGSSGGTGELSEFTNRAASLVKTHHAREDAAAAEAAGYVSRPGTASSMRRPGTAGASGGPVSSAGRRRGEGENLASDLTTGGNSVFCGSAIRGLRGLREKADTGSRDPITGSSGGLSGRRGSGMSQGPEADRGRAGRAQTAVGARPTTGQSWFEKREKEIAVTIVHEDGTVEKRGSSSLGPQQMSGEADILVLDHDADTEEEMDGRRGGHESVVVQSGHSTFQEHNSSPWTPARPPPSVPSLPLSSMTDTPTGTIPHSYSHDMSLKNPPKRFMRATPSPPPQVSSSSSSNAFVSGSQSKIGTRPAPSTTMSSGSLQNSALPVVGRLRPRRGRGPPTSNPSMPM